MVEEASESQSFPESTSPAIPAHARHFRFVWGILLVARVPEAAQDGKTGPLPFWFALPR